jgi:hypothetical protein
VLARKVKEACIEGEGRDQEGIGLQTVKLQGDVGLAALVVPERGDQQEEDKQDLELCREGREEDRCCDNQKLPDHDDDLPVVG